MHDIWNPWHGCIKCSEGCQNCYMYYLDKRRGQDGSVIRKTKSGFNYPLQRTQDGSYKVKPGELIRVCMTSDFFLEEADCWRDEAWDIMYQRPDVKFFLLTKRPQRVRKSLPSNWGAGWPNVMLNVTCENQKRADERIPILFELPFRHKGIMCAPLIGPVDISRYLEAGEIEQVLAGGENYDGSRPCDFDWVRKLHTDCLGANVSFSFIETGSVFIKDGKTYRMPSKLVQSRMAWKSGMSFKGKPIDWKLQDPLGFPIPEDAMHRPEFRRSECEQCGSRLICNGDSSCG